HRSNSQLRVNSHAGNHRAQKTRNERTTNPTNTAALSVIIPGGAGPEAVRSSKSTPILSATSSQTRTATAEPDKTRKKTGQPIHRFGEAHLLFSIITLPAPSMKLIHACPLVNIPS